MSLLLCNYSKMFWIMHSVVFFKKNLTGSILHIKIIKQKFMWWEYITAASVLTLGWVKVRIAQEGYDRGRIGTPLGVKKEKKYYPLIFFVEKLRKFRFQWSVIRKVKAPLSFFLNQHNSVYHGLIIIAYFTWIQKHLLQTKWDPKIVGMLIFDIRCSYQRGGFISAKFCNVIKCILYCYFLLLQY